MIYMYSIIAWVVLVMWLLYLKDKDTKKQNKKNGKKLTKNSYPVH